MPKSQDLQIDLFMKHVGYWSWVHVLYLYDETHLLIADEWFIDRVRNARPAPLKCQVARPDQFSVAVTDNIQKVLVFTERNELSIVRKLQAEHEGLHVTSGTYGFACVGKDRYPRLKVFQTPKLPKELKTTVILSTPYCDAEFVTKAMEQNGLMHSVEYLARPFSTWLERHKGFQITRFFHAAAHHYARDGKLFWHMQTDVLEALFKNTPYSLRHFVKDIQRMGAKVIFVSRDDRWTQSVTAQLLHRTTERSVWTKSPSKNIKSVRERGDFTGCLDWFDTLDAGCAMLSDIEKLLPASIHVKLQDFITDQPAGLKVISDFLNEPIGDEIACLDYNEAYDKAADVSRLTDLFQRELIDRLGIHTGLLCLKT